MGKRIDFERHRLTIAAMSRLRLLDKGQECPYSELRDILGCHPQIEGYCYVKSARDILTRDEGRIFAVAEGRGIRRLTDSESAKIIPDKQRRGTHAHMRRRRRELDNIALSSLTREEQAAVTVALAHNGSIMGFTNFHFVESSKRALLSKNELPPLPPRIEP